MRHTYRISIAAAALIAATGCSDYLTAGQASEDPNRPVAATNNQLLVGIEANTFALLGSDNARVEGIFAQQFQGLQSQYLANVESYQVTEQNTNGLNASLYTGGGLVDIRKLQAGAIASKDTTFLGIAQVYEGLVIGTGADLFGDIVYSEALTGAANPKLDDQLSVYDAVQALLSQALGNVQKTGGTNFGPGASDLVYGGNRARYVALIHTLKARFYMHTAEVRPGAYAQALAEAKLGIQSEAGNYSGAFFDAADQQNFWYQFEVIQGRTGYVVPNPKFVTLLQSRNDPRRNTYFNADASDLSDVRLAPDFQQPFVSYDENTLIWAEAAYRTGDQVTALAKLNEERVHNGLPAEVGVTGNALLTEILTEKYIVDFQLGAEAMNDYNRTCFPNLVPTGTPSGPIPARYYYDSSERQTNTNIPQPGTGVNTLKNRDNPKNATADGIGGACLGQ